MLVCCICGKRRISTNFYIRSNGKLRKDCKMCFRARVKKNYDAHPEKYKYNPKKGKEYRSSPKGAMKCLANGARQRELAFELPIEYFKNIKDWKCFYCGSPVIDKFLGSLDRIDNEKGYYKDNVVPCCWVCNKMKNNLSQELFLEKCRMITERRYYGVKKDN